jgi:hypothetical protein
VKRPVRPGPYVQGMITYGTPPCRSYSALFSPVVTKVVSAWMALQACTRGFRRVMGWAPVSRQVHAKWLLCHQVHHEHVRHGKQHLTQALTCAGHP